MQSAMDVVVVLLKDEATQHETQDFLDEAVFWAEATFNRPAHPNLVKLLGVCLESIPYLMIYETCEFESDLKTFLINGRG